MEQAQTGDGAADVKMQEGEAEGCGDQVAGGVVEAECDPRDQKTADSTDSPGHGVEMSDTDMQDTGDRTTSAASARSPTKPKRRKQRTGRAGKKLTDRGRSPTVRPRLSTQERDKQKAAFRKRSTELQEQIDKTSVVPDASLAAQASDPVGTQRGRPMATGRWRRSLRNA
jgi:hypothetical protein